MNCVTKLKIEEIKVKNEKKKKRKMIPSEKGKIIDTKLKVKEYM